MDLLEHQGKAFLAAAGVPVPPGLVARTPDEAVSAGAELGWPVVLKAQVRAGGRGKAGGIRVVADAEEARRQAASILDLRIGGHDVRRLWVEAACSIEAEWYTSLTFDRAASRHLALLSARGGVDIEALAVDEPGAIARHHIDPIEGLPPEAAAELVTAAGLGAHTDQLVSLLGLLYTAYVGGDAELVEVNPLVRTGEGRVLALDAKVTLDDSATFRHPEWEQWQADDDTVDPRDREARRHGLNYVGLDGTVGVIGNGAGLVMSTLDVISNAGGRAANFLDVGGGASAAVLAAALEVVNDDPAVRAILVNIFGGITRGEEVANGIVTALERVALGSPIVVRLDGTNAAEGRAILAAHESDRLVFRSTMTAAAETAVALAAGARS